MTAIATSLTEIQARLAERITGAAIDIETAENTEITPRILVGYGGGTNKTGWQGDGDFTSGMLEESAVINFGIYVATSSATWLVTALTIRKQVMAALDLWKPSPAAVQEFQPAIELPPAESTDASGVKQTGVIFCFYHLRYMESYN